MKRNLPILFSQFVKLLPKFSIRTGHEDSRVLSRQSHPIPISKIKPRNDTPLHALPILDSSVPFPSSPKQEIDHLAMEIKSAIDLKELLEIGGKLGKQLQGDHLAVIFRSILEFQQSQKTCYSIGELQHDQGFVTLCGVLRRMAPTLSSNDLITCLKTLQNCDVAPDSRVIQTLLHVLKRQVNELEIHQIIFLSFLLQRLKSPLAEALHSVLPVVFETQLDLQLPRDNVNLMCEALSFATTHRLPAAKVMLIADRLMLTNTTSWTGKDVQRILWSLGRMIYLDEHGLYPLLDTTLNRLVQLIGELSPKEMKTVLNFMVANFSVNSKYWYKEDVCTAIANRAVLEKWPLSLTSLAARTFTKMGYIDFDFLDYFASIVTQSEENTPIYINSLAPFAMANYKPKNFEAIMEYLLASKQLKNEENTLHSILFAVNCATLDFYSRTLLHKIFSPSFSQRMDNESDGSKSSILNLVLLDLAYRSVRIECPEYDGPFLSSDITVKAHKSFFNLNKQFEPDVLIPLENALKRALGGEQYLISGLLTKFGHYVDFMLVMGPSGSPVPIVTDPRKTEDSPSYVENIDVTNDCRRFLVKVFRDTPLNWNVSNKNFSHGYTILELRTLERAGYHVIPINLEKWQKLLDQEKIPFLKQLIRSPRAIH